MKSEIAPSTQLIKSLEMCPYLTYMCECLKILWSPLVKVIVRGVIYFEGIIRVCQVGAHFEALDGLVLMVPSD